MISLDARGRSGTFSKRANGVALRWEHIIRRGAAMPRVIHFEIPAENPDQLVEFYIKTFG